MGKSTNQISKLLAIKIIHTVIWAFFVLVIFYILYSGITNSIGILTWMGIALIVLEGIILFINGWRCPLTILGEKYTDQTEVGFDIFLPRWVAKNNKAIFTTIFFISVIIVFYRVLT